jgi:hypothetical protein
LLGLVVLALFALPTAARAQGGGSLGPPMWEMPMPLMWGERNEGIYTAFEALIMRINNPLHTQVVGIRGIFDEAGTIQGQGELVNVNDGRIATTPYITTLFGDRGVPGQFLGSGMGAMTTGDVGDDKYEPGMRFTIGYRFRNGVAIEGNYWSLAATRHQSSAGIVPPRNFGGVGSQFYDSFISAPFFNFTPYFAGPSFDVISNTYLLTRPAGANPVNLVTAGNQNGANQVITTDDVINDLIRFRGFVVPAYGIANGAELMEQSLRQRFASAELNARVPFCTAEVTRTYGLIGVRYINFDERYRLRIVDMDIEGSSLAENAMQYENKISNKYYGGQAGIGTESYIANGFAITFEGKLGVLAENSRATVKVLREDLAVGLRKVDNQVNTTTMFQAGAYLWWYPMEGIQMRIGYEFLGILGSRRSPDPVDFDLGKLNPGYDKLFLRVDGVTGGLAFIF